MKVTEINVGDKIKITNKRKCVILASVEKFEHGFMCYKDIEFPSVGECKMLCESLDSDYFKIERL